MVETTESREDMLRLRKDAARAMLALAGRRPGVATAADYDRAFAALDDFLDASLRSTSRDSEVVGHRSQRFDHDGTYRHHHDAPVWWESVEQFGGDKREHRHSAKDEARDPEADQRDRTLVAEWDVTLPTLPADPVAASEAGWTCEWCGAPLTPDDGVWTDESNSGDYCPEGRAVGPTGTSPHLPRRSPGEAEFARLAEPIVRWYMENVADPEVVAQWVKGKTSHE